MYIVTQKKLVTMLLLMKLQLMLKLIKSLLKLDHQKLEHSKIYSPKKEILQKLENHFLKLIPTEKHLQDNLNNKQKKHQKQNNLLQQLQNKQNHQRLKHPRKKHLKRRPLKHLPHLKYMKELSEEYNLMKKENMSRMRQKIAQRLKDAQNTYALLTTFQEIDMSNIIETRNLFQTEFQKKHNVKLGFMSFFVKASVAALKEFPIVNAVIDGNQIVHRNFHDISVAVATPNGLMVPVIRNCEQLSFADIEKELISLANKGKEGKIQPEDMAGGTFTITNGGVFGSLMGTPIINAPQSARLGMHSTINRPVVRGDQIVARPMMYAALTYDHRIMDGREGALFLKKIQTVIEDPKRLLLDI